ncbi:MAG: NAD-dependent epimerase/dehydratase family protein [Candidatus Saccharicenans sp.]
MTGGTGFIGQNLVRNLLATGENVRLLVRDISALPPSMNSPLEIIQTNLLDQTSLTRALKGCSYLYHLASYARNWAFDKNIFFKINVEGLRNILEASLNAGLKRVVYVSSSVVSGPSSDRPVAEETIRGNIPFFTEYQESKAQSEKIIPEYLRRNLEVVIARPTRVFGPGRLSEANSVTKLIRFYLSYRVGLLLNQGQEIGNYVYVDDIVEGLKLIMARGRNGEAYILGGENISLSGFYDLLEAVSGLKALRIKIPASLALAIARLESLKARKFKIYPLITEGWVKTFLQNWAFSHEKASRELGYRPRNLKEGLKLTIDWLGWKPAIGKIYF